MTDRKLKTQKRSFTHAHARGCCCFARDTSCQIQSLGYCTNISTINNRDEWNGGSREKRTHRGGGRTVFICLGWLCGNNNNNNLEYFTYLFYCTDTTHCSF